MRKIIIIIIIIVKNKRNKIENKINQIIYIH